MATNKTTEGKPIRVRQFRGDLAFTKMRARMFSDESLLSFGVNSKGERVCYGVSIDKFCKALDEGRF